MNPQRKLTATVLAVGALLAAPVVAGAVPWPQLGGDAGHSGNQPVNEASMPTQFLRELDDAGSMRTPVLIAGGNTADRPIMYGRFEDTGTGGNTDNDQTKIHMRTLDAGTERVPANQQVIDDSNGTGDDDVLGDGNEFISPLDTSSADAPGQLYVLHNDENSASAQANECINESTASSNDIAIAQFDIATGAQKKDVAIGLPSGGFPSPDICDANPQVTEGYTLDSSPVITPPDAEGDRHLFAVLRKNAGGDGRLIRVRIDNAGSPDAVIHSTTPAFRDIPNLNTNASPTIAYFTDPDRETVIPYVVVAINAAPGAADIKAYKVQDIGGSQIDLEVPNNVPGHPQTVSVPVNDNGTLPGSDDNGKAPALYAAYHDDAGTPADISDDTTTIRKFVQEGQNETLTWLQTGVEDDALDGMPAVTLALSEEVSKGSVIEGRVIVTTSENVYALDSETLTVVDRLRDAGESPLSFVRNAPIHSGGFVFVQSDTGALYTLALGNGLERVPQNQFVEPDANNTSTSAIGAPAYSNGNLVFSSNLGIWHFRTNVVAPPNQPPVANFTITPNPSRQGQTVTLDASPSTDADGSIVRFEWDVDNNGQFETDRGTEKTLQLAPTRPGTYPIGLRVTDAAGATSTVVKDVIVGANQPPIAVFTTNPSFGETGSPVNFDASASRDPDGSIAKYQWDLDGNGSFETDTGTNPKASRTYTTAGVINVKLRVTDNDGAASEVVRQLSVAAAARRTPTISARVTPKRDVSLPLRFTTSGRIGLPRGVRRADGCRGRVTVSVKAGKRTVSRRTTSVNRDCRYRTRVTFRNRRRIGSRRVLRFIARFQGNSALRARQAKTVRRRVG